MATPAPMLLGGPYQAPTLRHGDRATCLYRDADVIITSWTAAPIPWPRCRVPGHHGAGSGLLVTEELVRAIRTESALALKHHFGVSAHTAWSWRRTFGVKQWGTEGSRRLHRVLSDAGTAALRGRKATEDATLLVIAVSPLYCRTTPLSSRLTRA
jgi:hypothetical protein